MNELIGADRSRVSSVLGNENVRNSEKSLQLLLRVVIWLLIAYSIVEGDGVSSGSP